MFPPDENSSIIPASQKNDVLPERNEEVLHNCACLLCDGNQDQITKFKLALISEIFRQILISEIFRQILTMTTHW